MHDISPGTEIYVTICRLQSITINRSIYGCLLNEKIPEELMTLKIIKKVNLKVKTVCIGRTGFLTSGASAIFV